MNIQEYDRFLGITDNASSDKWYNPSEFNIIKNPPRKFRTVSGAPTSTSKMLLREPAAFVYWAYLYYLSLNRNVEVYYPLDGTWSSRKTRSATSGAVNYLYKSLYCPFGVTDNHSGYLSNHLMRIVQQQIAPSVDAYYYNLERIPTSILESRYPNYSYIGDNLKSGSPLTSKIVNALASRARLAKDVLNGGFDGYEYDNEMLVNTGSYISQTKNCYVKKSTSTSSSTTTITFTIEQQKDSTSGTIDKTAPILDISISPKNIKTTVVIFLQFTFSFDPSSGYSRDSGRGFPTVDWPSPPDVFKTEIHEITFTGSKRITNADVGLGSFDDLIDKAKSALDRDFFELNSTNYSKSDQSTETLKYVTEGSAKVGKLTVDVSYYAFLKHQFPIPN